MTQTSTLDLHCHSQTFFPRHEKYYDDSTRGKHQFTAHLTSRQLKKEGKDGLVGFLLNPFSSGTHFNREFWV
ncbi:hypothetical protein E2C01_040162 [Portunus trituberculatus]|uniref:Uncharacterized protein n=1 Tax=Portunus trituberculatus TaxID=210409 RepID=A0A5B7FIY1_PORTR|nr:hypothetical protein [Portunus trituberculatus]